MPGQKGMDEFIYVLLTGLLMIIVMLIFWGIPPEVPPENDTGIMNISNAFGIGAYPQDIPRHIRIGDFTVSYAVGSEVLSEKRNVEVRKGLFVNEYFSMSGEIKQNMDLVTDGFLVIEILDTNSRGNLIIKINDKVVFNRETQPGRLDIPVDKDLLKEYNVISVSSSSPGWMLWTSSVYKIDRIEFGINFWGRSEKTEYFEAYRDELSDFKSGKVEFELEDSSGEGDLIIKINDQNIFKGQPSRRFSQPFDSLVVGLKIGTNKITFYTEEGTSYQIDDAEITIMHEEVGRKTRSFDFTVDSSEYERLKQEKGKIKFYIVDSNYLGSLLITITDAEGNKNLVETIRTYSTGEYKIVEFDHNHVKIGSNAITFEVSGEGTFVLSNLEIRV